LSHGVDAARSDKWSKIGSPSLAPWPRPFNGIVGLSVDEPSDGSGDRHGESLDRRADIFIA
jgi:hypothetical protein